MRRIAGLLLTFLFITDIAFPQWIRVDLSEGKQVVVIEQLVPVNITRIGLSNYQLRLYLESDYIIPAPEKSIIPVNRGVLRTATWRKEDSHKVTINLDFVSKTLKPVVSKLYNNIILEFKGEQFLATLDELQSYISGLKSTNPDIADKLLEDYKVLRKEENFSKINETVANLDRSDSGIGKPSLIDTLKSRNDSTAVLAYSEEIPETAIKLDAEKEKKHGLLDILLSPVALSVMFVLGLVLILYGVKEWFGIKLFKKKKVVPEGGEDKENAKKKRGGKTGEEVTEQDREAETESKAESTDAKSSPGSFNQLLMEAIKEVEKEDKFEKSKEADKVISSKNEFEGKKKLPELKRMDHNIIYQYYMMGYTPEVLSKELKLSLSEIHLALQLAEQSSGIDPDTRDKIFRLSRIGISNDEIARQLKLNVESVNLILWQGEA